VEKINIFWFRRDLRLNDNTGLDHAFKSDLPVLLIFIFDTNIIEDLKPDDTRISFIYGILSEINSKLGLADGSLLILKGKPAEIWDQLISKYDIQKVYINSDYEPYAIQRDREIRILLKKKGIELLEFKDQVIFEKSEILKEDGLPYTIFTPYKRAWLKKFQQMEITSKKNTTVNGHLVLEKFAIPSLSQLGFVKSPMKILPAKLQNIKDYDKYRDFPALDHTTRLGPHLRFGTVSIREIVKIAAKENSTFLAELIWREFFMQILFHFPAVVTANFRSKYDNIRWRNNDQEFTRWCNGETGYPIVDAGMRQLNSTGFMHNRVRMITAGFLCKHLLTDWRLGEAYFAEKLNDYELSSNNGNWQWAAGTGCDAAPYFRIFNPDSQQKRFDRENEYVKKWLDDLHKPSYPRKIVDHVFARERALIAYSTGKRKGF
jgi:deoxyribodipyrimidine photo-lyase